MYLKISVRRKHSLPNVWGIDQLLEKAAFVYANSSLEYTLYLSYLIGKSKQNLSPKTPNTEACLPKMMTLPFLVCISIINIEKGAPILQRMEYTD